MVISNEIRYKIIIFNRLLSTEKAGEMKKYKLLIGAMAIILAVYLVYLFAFKSYNTSDVEVDMLTKEEYVIELVDGSKIILDKNGNLIRHITDSGGNVSIIDVTNRFTNKQAAIIDSNASSVANSQTANKNNTPASVKSIKRKYAHALADIEKQAYDNLDELIHLATSEYLEMEANHQKISYPYFYNKYTNAASKLEARTDNVFYAIKEIMEYELKANGHSTKTVESMRKEYKSKKNKVRRDIMRETAGL